MKRSSMMRRQRGETGGGDVPFMRVATLVALLGCLSLGARGQSQDPAADEPPTQLTITVEPERLTVPLGETRTLTAEVRDPDGRLVEDAQVVYYSRSRRSVGVTREGVVDARRPGEFIVVALVPRLPAERSRRPEAITRVEIAVTVPQPPVDRVTFVSTPAKFYVGTRPRLRVAIIDTLGTVRHDVQPHYSTADAGVAEVDQFGFMTVHQPGAVDVAVTAEDATASLRIEAEPNPVAALHLEASTGVARTGDVVTFAATARDALGLAVSGVPIQFGVAGETTSTIIAAGAAAQIAEDGRFVAERSGTFTVIATSGSHSATRTVVVEPRNVRRDVEVLGRGEVLDRHTSDLWVWESTDGRDYAITGTWGSDGHAYVWDVTDPTDITRLHEVQVDARTINDVKVSEDGDIAVISREGASDRRNGIVVLGVGNPREGVPVLSEFTDQLTGGVHNVFVSDDHVFALSASRRYDVISIEDPRRPKRVGRFELDTPAHGVHDVWVSDGVAFSSNWTDGVVAVDVGGGGKGGTPEEPVELGRYAYPSGWNHTAFPYRSQSTGTFYIFAADESFPYGGFRRNGGTTPSRAAGWVHVIDWSDWQHPREVARYQVPEAGTHNLWVEDDVMYVAYYNGGLRVVDVSGELMGDLYKQGREIAMFLPHDPDGFIAKAPFVWGPQPYKGNVFFTDWNTGLWAVTVQPRDRPRRTIGEPQ